MRQGQHNKRARGRGRKPQNPANRTYDSNGPDVKIRGTAAHIAEKYQSLARDAQVAGDPISAENYMQHAEHYSRIIAAAQAQMQSQQAAQENAGSGHGANGAGRPDQDEQNKPQPQQAESSDDKSEKAASGQAREENSGGDDEGRAKRPRGRRRPKVVSVDGAQADGAGSDEGAPQASAPVSEAGNNNSGDSSSPSDGPVIAEAG